MHALLYRIGVEIWRYHNLDHQQVAAGDQRRFVGQAGDGLQRSDLRPGAEGRGAGDVDLDHAVRPAVRDLHPVGERIDPILVAVDAEDIGNVENALLG